MEGIPKGLKEYESSIRATGRDVVTMTFEENDDDDYPVWHSRSSGRYYYLPKGFKWPSYPKEETKKETKEETKEGDSEVYLKPVFQLNFEEVPANILPSHYPTTGILQLWIDCSSPSYGLNESQLPGKENTGGEGSMPLNDWGEGEIWNDNWGPKINRLNNTFRIVFFEHVTHDEDSLWSRGEIDHIFEKLDDRYSPVDEGVEYKINFKREHHFMSRFDRKFDETFPEIIEEGLDELYGMKVPGGNGGGSHLWGYPGFAQEDPRQTIKNDDIELFLQLAGDDQHWGDDGFAHIFVDLKKLKQQPPPNLQAIAHFYWDCA